MNIALHEIPIEEITEEFLRTLSDEDLLALEEIEKDRKVFAYNVSYTKKIEINSLYGMLGAMMALFYDSYLASSVTAFGRFSIRSIGQIVDEMISTEVGDIIKKYNVTNDKPNGTSLVYAHTDSSYFEFEPLYEKMKLDNPNMSENELEEWVLQKGKFYCDYMNKTIFPDIINTFNGRENKMNMNFEVYADKGIFLKKARYYLRLRMKDDIILSKPKYKTTGMELKKASAPKITKDLVVNALDIFLDKSRDEIRNFLVDCEKKFMSAPIEDIFRKVNVKKVSEFEAQEGAVKDIKEAIREFSVRRRKHIADGTDNKKYQDIISEILKQVGSTPDELELFLQGVERWTRRVYEEGDNKYSEINRSLNKLMKFDEYVTSEEKTKDRQNHTYGEIGFISRFNKILTESTSCGYTPNKQFAFNIGDRLMKGLSFNSKLAIIHNTFLEQNREKYPTVEPIYDGDKIKWCCLKTPNPFMNSDKMGIKSEELLPLIEKYIDKDKQFLSGFETVIKEIAGAVGVNFFYNANKRFI